MPNEENVPIGDDTPTERGVSPTSTTMINGVLGETPIRSPPLPILIESIYGSNWRDITKATKSLMLAEWQEIIDIVDIKPVFSVSSFYGFIKLMNVRVKKCDRKTFKIEINDQPPSRSTVANFLDFLHYERLLELKIVKTGYLSPAKVYYVQGTPADDIDRFIVYYVACEEDYLNKKKTKKRTVEEQAEYQELQSKVFSKTKDKRQLKEHLTYYNKAERKDIITKHRKLYYSAFTAAEIEELIKG